MATPVVLDCDPGVDDAAGILLACASPALNVRAITTVGGNTGIAQTTRNALDLLAFAGIEGIPVAQGAGRAMLHPFGSGAGIHGAAGFGGVALPQSSGTVVALSAVDLIAQTVRDSAEPVTLIPTGPLTNIALFLLQYPDLHSRIAHICLMGGAAYEGNVTPSAEANIFNDPEAARIVFDAGVPVTMIGLHLTMRARFTPAHVTRLRDTGKKVATAFAQMLEFRMRAYGDTYGYAGAPLHDPLAVAQIVRPGIVTTQQYAVEIETVGTWTRGRTVVDLLGVTGRTPHVAVGMDADIPAFTEMLLNAIASYA